MSSTAKSEPEPEPEKAEKAVEVDKAIDNESKKISPKYNKLIESHPISYPSHTIHHSALNQLLPLSVIGKSGQALINELLKNNLANKIINVYYRIKKNVEYISVGKESLYPITPQYKTSGTDLLNCRNSRHLFYLIHHQNVSFGHLVQFTAHFIELKKMFNHRKDYRVSF